MDYATAVNAEIRDLKAAARDATEQVPPARLDDCIILGASGFGVSAKSR
jgi:hypothetical protein